MNIEGMMISMMSMIIAAGFGAALGVWRYGWPAAGERRFALAPVRLPTLEPVQHMTVDVKTFTTDVWWHSNAGGRPTHRRYVLSVAVGI